MDKITAYIKKYERIRRYIGIAGIAVAVLCLLCSHLAENSRNINSPLFDVAWVLFWVFLAIEVAYLFVHYILIKPLVRYKLEDFMETKTPDPDFDYNKYIDIQ